MQSVKNASFAKAAAVLVAVLAFALSLCAVNTTSAYAQAAPATTPNKSITVTVNKSTVADLSFTMDKEWAGKTMYLTSITASNSNITTLSLVSNQAIIGDDGTVVCYASVKAAHVGNYYATLTTRLDGATKFITIPLTINVTKANNVINVKTTKFNVKKKAIKKAKKVLDPKATAKYGNAKLTFKKVSGASCLSVNSKTGKITMKKHKCPKSVKSHKIKVKITAAATADYKATSVTKTITVTMK